MEKNNHTTSKDVRPCKDARPCRDARPCVSTRRNNIARLITLGLLAAAAIAIASLTVGRDIYHGSAGEGMTSFAIVNFAGYLFFLFMPVELAFIYYVSEGVNLWTLNGIAIGTALLSQTVDYLIGYSFSTRIINRLIGRRRYLKAESRIRKDRKSVV